MPSDQLLPIKVVFKRDEDYVAPHDGGGSWNPFCAVTPQLRSTLAEQVDKVREYFAQSFQDLQDVPAVAQVSLKPEAVAKTYRPTELFNLDTCPIIGANRLGELYVSVHPRGLDRLADKITSGQSQTAKAHISTLDAIRPYTATDALGATGEDQLRAAAPRKKMPRVRFRLFRHQSDQVNEAIDAAFEQVADENGIGEQDRDVMDYAEGLRVYRLRNVSVEKVILLAKFVGTQSLSAFPEYRIVRTTSRVIGNINALRFPPPDPKRGYGLVGLIDSGTDPNNKHLQAWVIERFDFVPRAMQNNDHGSFVAGLLVHGRELNNQHPSFPGASSRIVDVVALDKAGGIGEDDLLTVIDEALTKYPDVKVWNLSLGVEDSPCADHEFSLLGAALDQRAKDSGVLFVIAAGNYQKTPLRFWPPQPGLADDDRICPPGDSLRGITVGSVAHLETTATCVRCNEPSPFSRRGPGPAYTVKPELSGYGGNCTQNGHHIQTGVVSVDGSGHIAENIGTSFATPLVATVAANVYRELNVGPRDASPALAKALMVHAAFMRNAPLDPDRINYSGAGLLPEVAEILNCRQSSATIILQIPVQRKPEYGKRPFPMPKSLAGPDGFRGEVFMTLLYEPPLDRGYGIEYCRCNVNASLGTILVNPGTGEESYTRQIHPHPKELGEGYEKDLIKHSYKWSPLKLYYRKFQRRRGPVGLKWRLTLETLDRAHAPRGSQHDVNLVITVRAAEPTARIYDELVRDMDRLGWGAQDLQIRSRSRLRP